MADPVTLAAISIGASAAGGGIGALGSIMGGNAKNAQFKYQAGVADLNAKIARQNADYQRQTGEVEAQSVGLKTRSEIGQTKATQAAGGLAVNSGSNAQVRDSEETIGQQNETIVRSNAARRAYSSEVEAIQYDTQAQIDRMAGKNAKTAGYIGAASSILGAAGSVSGKWLQAGTAGINLGYG